MRIPTITDEMAVRVFENTASPVCLLVTALGEKSAWVRAQLQIVADDFDDKVIFLTLVAEEHPEYVELLGVTVLPTLLIFKRAKEVDRVEAPTVSAMQDALERVWNRGQA